MLLLSQAQNYHTSKESPDQVQDLSEHHVEGDNHHILWVLHWPVVDLIVCQQVADQVLLSIATQATWGEIEKTYNSDKTNEIVPLYIISVMPPSSC